MYALPSRAALLAKMNDQSKMAESDVIQLLKDISTIIRPIYNETQDLYCKNDLRALQAVKDGLFS